MCDEDPELWRAIGRLTKVMEQLHLQREGEVEVDGLFDDPLGYLKEKGAALAHAVKSVAGAVADTVKGIKEPPKDDAEYQGLVKQLDEHRKQLDKLKELAKKAKEARAKAEQDMNKGKKLPGFDPTPLQSTKDEAVYQEQQANAAITEDNAAIKEDNGAIQARKIMYTTEVQLQDLTKQIEALEAKKKQTEEKLEKDTATFHEKQEADKAEQEKFLHALGEVPGFT